MHLGWNNVRIWASSLALVEAGFDTFAGHTHRNLNIYNYIYNRNRLSLDNVCGPAFKQTHSFHNHQKRNIWLPTTSMCSEKLPMKFMWFFRNYLLYTTRWTVSHASVLRTTHSAILVKRLRKLLRCGDSLNQSLYSAATMSNQNSVLHEAKRQKIRQLKPVIMHIDINVRGKRISIKRWRLRILYCLLIFVYFVWLNNQKFRLLQKKEY